MSRSRSTLRSPLVAALTFDHLYTFKVVVEARSFRRAAEKLAMSQAAVSQRVRYLEQILGAPLFDRQRGGAPRLTQAGERLRALAEAALGELEHFRSDVQGLLTPRAGDRFTVAAGPSFIKYRLLLMIREFNRQYPDVEVRLRHSASPEEVLTLVLNGEADLGIHVGHPAGSQVRSFPIAEDRLVLVAPPGHPILDTPAERRLLELPRVPFAIPSAAAHSRQLVHGWASHHGMTLRIKIEADNLDTLKEAVLQGVALAILPDFAVSDELQRGKLVAVEAPGLPLVRKVSAVAAARASLSPTIREFIRRLADLMRGQNPAGRVISSGL